MKMKLIINNRFLRIVILLIISINFVASIAETVERKKIRKSSNTLKSKVIRKFKKMQPTTSLHFSNKKAPKIDKPFEWMRYIHEDLPLTALSIPGTHDSCAQRFDDLSPIRNKLGSLLKMMISDEEITENAITQSWSILDQLNVGIRYFDIRLRTDGYVYHGELKSGYSFKQVLDAVKGFLTTNSYETVIMRLKKEVADDKMPIFLTRFSKDLEGYKDMFIFMKRIPILKEVRGKVLPILDGFEFEDAFKWGANKLTGVDLQDDFRLMSGYESKRDDIRKQCEEALTTRETNLFFNHFSASGVFNVYNLVGYDINIQSIANEMNQVAFEYNAGRLGVTIFDFPSSQLIEYIYRNNPFKATDELADKQFNINLKKSPKKCLLEAAGRVVEDEKCRSKRASWIVEKHEDYFMLKNSFTNSYLSAEQGAFLKTQKITDDNSKWTIMFEAGQTRLINRKVDVNDKVGLVRFMLSGKLN